MAQLAHRHFLGGFLLADDLARILLHGEYLRLKAHPPLKVFVCDVVDIPLVHDPLAARPLGVLGVLDVRDLAVRAEDLQADPRQLLLFGIVGARVDETLDLAALDLLDDDVLLRLHARVALDLVVDHVAIRRIRARDDVLVEEDRTDAHEKAKQDRGRSNTAEADAAGLHCRDLARRGKSAKRQKTCEEHRHRERPHDDPGQTEHEYLYDGRQGCPVVRDVLCNAKKRARADENCRERTDGKEKGQKDLTKYILVKNTDFQMHTLPFADAELHPIYSIIFERP